MKKMVSTTVALALLFIFALGGAALAADTEVRSFENQHSFSSTVHVIHSEQGNVLVDPGFYSDELKAYVESIGGLDAILITHGHWDNVAGLDACVADNPDTAVYLHELDCPFLNDPVLNASRPNGFDLTQETVPTPITGEGRMQIGGYEVQMIHMPGHTCGSCMFYLEDDNALFSGDMFMIPFVGSAKHPTGSEEDRAASIQKFLGLGFKDDLRIYPGHRGNTTYGEMLISNEDLQ